MLVNVGKFLDRLMSQVRPKKVLFMAIDGVAPRAKMNQQRARRFCSAKEAEEHAAVEQQVRALMMSQGQTPPPEKGARWDHNVITPGTAFMEKLACFLQRFAEARVKSDPAWKGLQVVLSDATVPGEGEHKLIEFIRRQRAQPDYDATTSHCICGQDADLMMLGLALHELRVTVLREQVFLGRKKSRAFELYKRAVAEQKTPLQLLHVYRLRQYLEEDFKELGTAPLYSSD
jgi:5'-3' exoribonuclease 2